jgi:hypothetical protein
MYINVYQCISQGIPEHVVPPSFYQMHFLIASPAAGKQSSIVTMSGANNLLIYILLNLQHLYIFFLLFSICVSWQN